MSSLSTKIAATVLFALLGGCAQQSAGLVAPREPAHAVTPGAWRYSSAIAGPRTVHHAAGVQANHLLSTPRGESTAFFVVVYAEHIGVDVAPLMAGLYVSQPYLVRCPPGDCQVWVALDKAKPRPVSASLVGQKILLEGGAALEPAIHKAQSLTVWLPVRDGLDPAVLHFSVGGLKRPTPGAVRLPRGQSISN